MKPRPRVLYDISDVDWPLSIKRFDRTAKRQEESPWFELPLVDLLRLRVGYFLGMFVSLLVWSFVSVCCCLFLPLCASR